MKNLRDDQRIVVTGLSLITPLGDDPQIQLEKMLRGESAIRKWTRYDTSQILSKVGGDLGHRSPVEGLAAIAAALPPEVAKSVKKLISRAPWSTGHSVEVALRAAVDSDFFKANLDPMSSAVIVAGSNISTNYIHRQYDLFNEEPDYIDPLCSVMSLDSDHVGCVSEALTIKGGGYIVAGACASGNMALRIAMDEIRNHGLDRVFVVGPIYDPSIVELHGLALVKAMSIDQFNEEPARASRPFDTRREGFVASHAAAALVIESLASAKRRGVRIYAELLGVENSSDANHLPNPSLEGQVRALKKLFGSTKVKPEEIDFVSAHATSTPRGDMIEIQSLKEVFGQHVYNLKINAPKSILGHPCWSAGVVESVVGLLQMQAGKLHPSINIDELDPEIDLPIVRGAPVDHQIRMMINNSFGFGGLNSVSLFSKFEENS